MMPSTAFLRGIIAIGAWVVLGAATPLGAEENSGRRLTPPPQVTPALAGMLSDQTLWRSYKKRFVTEQGRVVDTGNGRVSHSEGQGYGLLLAVAANDREAFERIWGWTRANLMVRGDQLMAWRWEPDARPAVADMNNASDGDLLIAWALAEAAIAWSDAGYRVASRRIAVELGRKLILTRTSFGPLLLPAVSGFAAEDRGDGPIVNLSYWVFPALDRLASVAPEIDWAAITGSGLKVLAGSRSSNTKLPAEWLSARNAELRPAQGLATTFAYNAIRIPLYLAWAGLGAEIDYAPFMALWNARPAHGLPIVDTGDGRTVASFGESGYSAIADLTACAAKGTRLPAGFRNVRVSENYYPVTLHMLAQIAVQMRFPSCLRG